MLVRTLVICSDPCFSVPIYTSLTSRVHWLTWKTVIWDEWRFQHSFQLPLVLLSIGTSFCHRWTFHRSSYRVWRRSQLDPSRHRRPRREWRSRYRIWTSPLLRSSWKTHFRATSSIIYRFLFIFFIGIKNFQTIFFIFIICFYQYCILHLNQSL